MIARAPVGSRHMFSSSSGKEQDENSECRTRVLLQLDISTNVDAYHDVVCCETFIRSCQILALGKFSLTLVQGLDSRNGKNLRL